MYLYFVYFSTLVPLMYPDPAAGWRLWRPCEEFGYVCLLIGLFVCLGYLSFYPSISWSLYLFMHVWLSLSICLPQCLAVFLVLSFPFYTSTKSWRGYIFTAVCLCMCLCVCVSTAFLWTEFQPNRCTDLDAVFAKWLLTALAQKPIEIGDLGSKIKVTMT